jgi:exodeoxyribonuclease-1
MLVTGVTVDQLVDPELPSHYEMVCSIRAKMEAWSPAVFIGHNSIQFDEPLVRQALYQNLHPPYLTNTNGNCRADSLRIAQAIHLYSPGTLTIPKDGNGRETFKLDQLAPANGFQDHAAHDAMGDVEATVHLCRLLAAKEGDHWSNLIRFSQKAAVQDFIQEEYIYLLSDSFFGKTYSWPVVTLGANPDYGAESLVFNLTVDPDDLVGLSDGALSARLAVTPKPVRGLRTNAIPIVLAMDDVPEHIRQTLPDLGELQRRANVVCDDMSFKTKLIETFLARKEPRESSVYVEEQIYDSFTSNSDNDKLSLFHAADWCDCANILNGLEDQRLATLGERLIHAEAPESMSNERRQQNDIAVAKRLLAEESEVPWLTLPKAIADTEDMLSVANGEEESLLGDLRDYLKKRVEKASQIIS